MSGSSRSGSSASAISRAVKPSISTTLFAVPKPSRYARAALRLITSSSRRTRRRAAASCDSTMRASRQVCDHGGTFPAIGSVVRRGDPSAGREAMADKARMWATPLGGVLGELQRRVAELDGWNDGPVKDLGREAVRAELARVGRAMVELEWRWA